MQSNKGVFRRAKKGAGCQTLKTQLDAQDGQSQTDSIKKIIEDFQDDQKRQEKAEAKRKSDPKYAIFINSQELKDAFKSQPENVSEKVLAKWNSLGPLSVETILQNSNIAALAIDPEDVEFKKWDNGYAFKTGFHKKGSKHTRHGICRFEEYGYIYECMYVDDSRNGFGRVIYSNGKYYIGMWKDNLYHG